MSSFATARIDSPMMMSVSATPALAHISASSVMMFVVPPTEQPPANAPLEGLHAGSLFLDRTDGNLLWYVPVYSIVPDPDGAFAFAATQSGHDDKGNPVFLGTVTLSLAKSLPADVPAFQARNPNAKIREIALSGLAAALTLPFKDGNGNDQHTTLAGSVSTNQQGALQVTFDRVPGQNVVILYEELMMFGGASLQLTGTYTLWRQIIHPVTVPAPTPAPPPPPRRLPIRPFMSRSAFASFQPGAAQTVMMRPSANMFANTGVVFHPGALQEVSDVQFHRPIDPPPAIPDPTYNPVYMPASWTFPLEKKYAGDAYSLKYTVSDGATTHPIINVNDLRDFNIRQTEYAPLTALGDISQRYPTLARAYLGTQSKTIVVIPARYAITRAADGLDSVCQALVDSTAAGTSKCKFEFSFLISADVSPIDILQFSQEVSANKDLQGYTVKLPDALKEDGKATIQTAFQSSAGCVPTSVPHAFSFQIQVRDDDSGSPAVASANLLIRQLSTGQQPFVSGSIPIKLDDFYPDPVLATVVLNFHTTAGESSEMTLAIDEQGQTINITNESCFPLRLSRYGLCTPQSISVTTVDQTVPSNAVFQIPLPADHASLSTLVDREPVLPDVIAKADIGPLMKFQTQDVQSTQYMLGVNAAPVNFDARGISQIDVSVALADLPDTSVPVFSLVPLRKLNQVNVLIPIQLAVSHLNATVRFTLKHSDASVADLAFTVQHEFIDDPILLVNDSDLNAATPA